MSEVKRSAKVGEYIKIIEHSNMYQFDKAGDILRVDGYCSVGCIYVLGKHHERNTNDSEHGWAYFHDDYVVLEGYQPKEGK